MTRYVVKKESGCGSLFFWIFGLGLLIAYAPYLIGFLLIVLAVWAIIYLPKRKKVKQQQAEEAELVERERQLDLEAKRLELARREQELKIQKSKINQTESEDTWGDF
ncbi:cbb3-type cytochrome oxidase subunit 3 [Enterococcus sp. PF1-24]|uniref:hypothetical protein n=1 Tax=unclassified Enterococcus TaxID=2608891 RepID=UPI002473C77C|nr:MULTISPECIES: hypothetical protein [unclassified Enterococcus]MDH6365669.1 cbb3-type cytochrome oxidase subunit 3 [Enterococcus sp. PFB1-1]MDH6402770.1 cbb3-type cytochrome oxidase subunit 3 [Enterococcus sp. PF1-24]